MADDPVAALADLYQVERRLAEVRKEMTRLRQTLDGDTTTGDGRPRLAVARARRDQLQGRLRDAEVQERTERARARTHEQQLYSGTIHNPRELSQLAGELEQLKGRLALEEVAEMELLGELDEAEAELRAAGDEATLARRELDAQEAAERDTLAEVADHRSRIAPARLHLYDRVVTHRPPPPVVEVRGGTCTGCRLPLSTSQVRALRMATEPITCETCGRIQRLA
ncbi:MAG: C4-type zinc ribbon domain-containing protein [Candidatus Dormibacteraeota bacterium]|nr:C4-type zinc ribbon domain-containing protein [Candidatus Dormibacteraeota bacterium]